MVNPSLLLGPGDRRLSSTGDVLRFLRRQIPIVPAGGINFVDARDAAAATVAAMERGPRRRALPARRPQLDDARVLRPARAGRPRCARRGCKLPDRAGRARARPLLEELYRARGKEPPVDRISVEMSEHFWYFDSSQGASASSASRRATRRETLDDTVRWLRRHARI